MQQVKFHCCVHTHILFARNQPCYPHLYLPEDLQLPQTMAFMPQVHQAFLGSALTLLTFLICSPELRLNCFLQLLSHAPDIKYMRSSVWCMCYSMLISSVQLLSCVRLFATPWTAACQASLSITSSRSLLKLMPIELVIPSNHLILCCPLLLLPLIFSSIRVFPNESALRIRWPKYWSFSFSISPSILMNTQDWSPLGWTGWIF